MAKKPPKPDDWLTPILEQMAEWPAVAHICIAAMTVPGFFWLYNKKWMILSLVTFFASIAFAYWGLLALYREWRYMRAIEAFVKGKTTYRLPEMERLVAGLFHLQGYKVQAALGDLSRQDVDLIATKKKEVLLIQFNHWNEDVLPFKAVQALHVAALALKASGTVLVCFGAFTGEVLEYATLKEMNLMDLEALQTFANQKFGFDK
jgi:hypothetical protein